MPRKIRATTALAAAAVTAVGLTGCSGLGGGNSNGAQAQSNGQASAPSQAGNNGSGSNGNNGNSGAGATGVPAANADANQQVAAEIQLKKVSVRTTNLNNKRLAYVNYTFSHPIRQVTQPHAFYLTGYATNHPVQAKKAVLDENDPNTVVVGFPAGTPVKAYSLAVVGNGAVADAHSQTSLQAALPIPHSYATAGLAAAPELQSVHADQTLDQVTYTFDEPIEAYGAPGSPGNPGNAVNQGGNAGGNGGNGGGNAASGSSNSPAGNSANSANGSAAKAGQVNPQQFGFYTPSGQVVAGNKLVSVEGSKVVIGFKSGGANLNDAARWFVKSNAVHSLQGRSNLIDAQGGKTHVPDLVSVKRRSQTTYDFTFDEPVKNAQQKGFVLYTNGGQVVKAAAVSTVNNARTIRARFTKAADFAGQITAGAVAAQAVQADDHGGAGNTVGLEAVNGGKATTATGPTAGPDLVKVSADPKSGGVYFTFDEPVQANSLNKNGFFVVTQDGRLANPRKVVTSTGGQVTGNRVLVLFDESDLQSAKAFTVNAGALQGTAGMHNPVGTVYVNGGGTGGGSSSAAS